MSGTLIRNGLLEYSMGEVQPRIGATEETHHKARVTKAKLGVTWDEFVQMAAEELDPDK